MLWLNDKSLAALGSMTATLSAAPALGVEPAGCVAVAAVDPGATEADVADGAAVAAGEADVAADGVDFASEPQEAATRPKAARMMTDRRSVRCLDTFMITPSLTGTYGGGDEIGGVHRALSNGRASAAGWAELRRAMTTRAITVRTAGAIVVRLAAAPVTMPSVFNWLTVAVTIP